MFVVVLSCYWCSKCDGVSQGLPSPWPETAQSGEKARTGFALDSSLIWFLVSFAASLDFEPLARVGCHLPAQRASGSLFRLHPGWHEVLRTCCCTWPDPPRPDRTPRHARQDGCGRMATEPKQCAASSDVGKNSGTERSFVLGIVLGTGREFGISREPELICGWQARRYSQEAEDPGASLQYRICE